MKTKYLSSILLGLAVASTVTACQKPASDQAATTHAPAVEPAPAPADGEQLERQIWSDIRDKNWTAVESKIAPGFQSVHTDGPRDKAGEMELMKGLNAGDATLSDFKVTPEGDDVIVTYWITVPETINGKRIDKRAMRQNVWRNTPTGWQWIAHANMEAVS